MDEGANPSSSTISMLAKYIYDGAELGIDIQRR